MMRRLLAGLALFALIWSSLAAADERYQAVTETLEHFLYGASIGSAEIHNEFWAEELVYTSSSGRRFGKAELMSGMEGATPRDPQQVETWYGAEQIQINFVNDLALLSFILTAGNGEQVNSRFYNSGVLIFRNGRWQALNWHATIKPEER